MPLMNRSVVLALSAVAAAALLTACDGESGPPSAGPAPNVRVENATTPARTTAPTTTAGAPKPALEDGGHFGYIKSVDLGRSAAMLTFDLAYLLTGDEANKEAARRGYPTPVDNDYFIVNDNPKLRTLPLADDVELRLLDWKHCCDTFFDGDLARFAGSFERTKYPAGNYKGTFSAYELTVENGVVIRVDEHFFP
jgi:hypothetical protein